MNFELQTGRTVLNDSGAQQSHICTPFPTESMHNCRELPVRGRAVPWTHDIAAIGHDKQSEGSQGDKSIGFGVSTTGQLWSMHWHHSAYRLLRSVQRYVGVCTTISLRCDCLVQVAACTSHGASASKSTSKISRCMSQSPGPHATASNHSAIRRTLYPSTRVGPLRPCRLPDFAAFRPSSAHPRPLFPFYVLY